MVLAGIQKNNPDNGLRRYDAWDLDTHLCGVALRNQLKMPRKPLIVIPAKAGIQVLQWVLDPGFRRGDGVNEF
jgi:hypothetical protein